MEKISIARRRLEKRKLPFSINSGSNSQTHNDTNTVESPPQMDVLKINPNALASLITEEIESLQNGKKQFAVEIVSGLENSLKMLVSFERLNSISGNTRELLTTEEAAQHLRVSKKTIYRQLRSGNLQGQKIGRQWRVLLSSLNSVKNIRGGDV